MCPLESLRTILKEQQKKKMNSTLIELPFTFKCLFFIFVLDAEKNKQTIFCRRTVIGIESGIGD